MTTSDTSLDRRTLLRRGAAAGALAWAAPVVAGQVAHAQEAPFCTPKCFPSVSNIEGRAWDICWGTPITIDGTTYNTPTTPPSPIPSSSNKAALIKVFANADLVCPCGDQPSDPLVDIVRLPQAWRKDNANNPNFFAADAQSTFGNGFFWFGTNGAVPQGVYTPATPACFILGPCLDNSGDRIFSICSSRPQFAYTPAGPCSAVGSILFAPDPNAVCEVSCGSVPPTDGSACPPYPL